jgi:hypothetical protein
MLHTRMRRTSVFITLPLNSVRDAPRDGVFVRFNESSLILADITTPSSIAVVCPKFPQAGTVRVLVIVSVGQEMEILTELKFVYVWPPTEVSPAKVVQSGGSTLTLQVRHSSRSLSSACLCDLGMKKSWLALAKHVVVLFPVHVHAMHNFARPECASAAAAF